MYLSAVRSLSVRMFLLFSRAHANNTKRKTKVDRWNVEVSRRFQQLYVPTGILMWDGYTILIFLLLNSGLFKWVYKDFSQKATASVIF
jgi:hypothetical protein